MPAETTDTKQVEVGVLEVDLHRYHPSTVEGLVGVLVRRAHVANWSLSARDSTGHTDRRSRLRGAEP